MEDSSSYEKVKHEKQRRNVMYMLFGQYVYIYINIYIHSYVGVINVLSYLYSFIKICYFSHVAWKLFLI